MSKFRVNVIECNHCGCKYDLAEFDYCPDCLMDNQGNDHNGEDNEGRDYDDFLRNEQERKKENCNDKLVRQLKHNKEKASG